ncbi:MAG TPA: nicotinamide-nucleotide amidohydrolase family protein [Anaerolineaceae bacterium]|nr:nicotinamide-nucleotide amidohydrolase family protein [Anaerolineaceae bacterium]
MKADKRPILLVFGTSADPIHAGHISLVVGAVRALQTRGEQVAEVMLMPVFRHHNLQDTVKRSLPLTFAHRFDLSQLAAEEIKRNLEQPELNVSVSRLEEKLAQKSNRPNFTSETLTSLRQQTDPGQKIAFLIGVDSFSGDEPNFGQWFEWDRLLETTMLVISPRQGFEPNFGYLQFLEDQGADLVYLDELSIPEISSREIRARLETGETPEALAAEDLISPESAAYIRAHDLIQVWNTLDSQQPQSVVIEETMQTDDLETRIGKLLFQKKLTLSLAESCTGGLIGHRLTNVPGSSEYFMGGIVSYAYSAKVNLLGVSWDTLKQHGAVSAEVVREMALGARRAFNTDIGLAVSCIAGPGGATPSKPVGTSWCGISFGELDRQYHFLLEGNRLQVKEQLAQKALETLLNLLEEIA